MIPTMKTKLLSPDAKLPTRATERSAGLDLYSPVDEVLAPGQRRRIGLGIRIQLPPGCEGQVRPRSGMAERHAVLAILGTIDEDYRGEINALMINHSPFPYTIHKGDRIAQLVVAPVVYVTVVNAEEDDDLGTTERGAGGFGSTGR